MESGESPPAAAAAAAPAAVPPAAGVPPKAKMPVKMMMMKAAAAKMMASKLPSKLPAAAPAAGAAATEGDASTAETTATPAGAAAETPPSTQPLQAVPPTAGVPPKAKMPVKMMMMKAAAAKMMASKLASKLPAAAPAASADVSPPSQSGPAADTAPSKSAASAETQEGQAATTENSAQPAAPPEAAAQPEAVAEIVQDDEETGPERQQSFSNPLQGGSSNPLDPGSQAAAPSKGKSKGKAVGKSPAVRPSKKVAQAPPAAAAASAPAPAADAEEKRGGGLFKKLVNRLVMPVAMIASAANSAANSISKAVGLESSAEKAARKKEAADGTESVKGTRDDVSSTGVPASLDGDAMPTGNAASDAASTVFPSVTNDADTASNAVTNDGAQPQAGVAPQGLPVVFKGMTEIDYLAKIDFLENQLVRAETQIANLTSEGRRLKENLYEREGPRVAQHMMELERQVLQLNHQLKKERDGVEYHRTAHLQALDELTKMHHVFKQNGDYKTCIEENMRLKNVVAELTQLKAEQAMRIDELEQRCMLIDSREGQFTASSGKSPYVHVRRAALCDVCRAAVDGQEEFLGRKLEWERGQAVMPIPPLLSQPWHQDPVTLMTQRPKSTPIGEIYDHPRPAVGARGWRELVTPTGQVVFHNIITNQSTLQRPPELASSTR